MRRTAGLEAHEDPERSARPVFEENPLGPQRVSLQSERTDEAERTLPRGADPRSEDITGHFLALGMAQTG